MMMEDGIQLYEERGDEKARQECMDAMLEVPDMLDEVEKATNPLAYKINDLPNFELSEKSKKILAKYN